MGEKLAHPEWFLVWTKPFGPPKKGKPPHITTVCGYSERDCITAAEKYCAIPIEKIKRLGGRIKKVRISVVTTKRRSA